MDSIMAVPNISQRDRGARGLLAVALVVGVALAAGGSVGVAPIGDWTAETHAASEITKSKPEFLSEAYCLPWLHGEIAWTGPQKNDLWIYERCRELAQERQTLEEAAKATCFKQRSSVRDLVERVRAMPPGGTVEMLETMEFSFCVGREEAVLKEEVRRGLRPAFKGQAEQEAQEAAERERASRPETDAEYFARTGFHYCDVRRGCNPAPMPLGQR
jgi:hypothetical protein